ADGLCHHDGVDCGSSDGGVFGGSADAGQICFGGGMSRLQPAICYTTLPLDLDLQGLNTDNCDPLGRVLLQQNGVEVCVVAAMTFTVATNPTQIRGTRPLVLAAAKSITINGAVTVASANGNSLPGAGSDPVACDPRNGVPATAGGGGGAAGGSF